MIYEYTISVEKSIIVSFKRSFTSDQPLTCTQVKGLIDEECKAFKSLEFDKVVTRPYAEVKVEHTVWSPGHYMERVR